MIQMPGSGQMVEAVEMEVADVTERWNTISLANGETIRLKAVVMQVFAVPGAKDPQGNQQYIVNSVNVMVVQKEMPKTSIGGSGSSAA